MRHYEMAYELIQRGHCVSIIASSFDHFSHVEQRLTNGESYKIQMIDGIRYLWLKSPQYKRNGARRIWNMIHFATSIAKKGAVLPRLSSPDIVMGSSPTLFAALAAEHLARKFRVPFVLEIRDLWPQSLVDLGSMSDKHPVVLGLSVIERHLYRHATHVISLLPGAKDYIVDRGGKADAVSWLPNGAKLQRLQSRHNGAPNEPFTVLYAGAHGLANGLDAVLNAAAILDKRESHRSIEVHLVGNGPEKARLQARADREHIRSIRFFDEVPKSMVASLMIAADALLLPLRKAKLYEFGVSPNKLYHYMAASRPIIFATGSSNNPVQEAGAGVTVPAEDPPAIADAIQTLALLTDEQRLAMGRRGREYVEKYHSIESLAENLERILLSAIPAEAGQSVAITQT